LKLLLQSLSSGEIDLIDAPVPRPRPHEVLIRSQTTVISTGTEGMLLEFGRAGWIGKAKQQPDRVRDVLDKIKTDGLATTLEAVRRKLNQPIPLGYSHCGVVMAVGSAVSDISVGDRVASNGNHAEVVCVPKTLCVRVPAEIDDESAAFATLGAISLQGIRLLSPTLGESVAVIGVGLLGLLAVQMLVANGCQVLAFDPNESRCKLAEEFGAEACWVREGVDPVDRALAFTKGLGVDGVLITASASGSEIVQQSAKMSRKRGRVVLVGVTGLELNRRDFFDRELSFTVSCSYGPGRYEPDYEGRGVDYPPGFVRWSAQRNMEAFLELVRRGSVRVGPLITHRFEFEQAKQAYEALGSGAMGIVLSYPKPDGGQATQFRSRVRHSEPSSARGKAVLGFIGAGNYATAVLIPAFREAGARLKIVASGGHSSALAARTFGFEESTSDSVNVLDDSEVGAVVIATRHESHSRLAVEALQRGKHVFVEKPLALDLESLGALESAAHEAAARGVHLMAGFNRRFAPATEALRDLLAGIAEPKTFVATMNAGELPREHWTRDIEVGGGRILGEACHFIDLLRFLAGSPIVGVDARGMRGETPRTSPEDSACILLSFEDGSIGTVVYTAAGAKSYPKERIECFAGGKVALIDNFKSLRLFGFGKLRLPALGKQDKGQKTLAAAFVNLVAHGGENPMALDEMFDAGKATVEAALRIRRQFDAEV